MKLDHINLDQLKLSPLNVRKRGGDEVDDLVPSIRAIGIIQPLLVRPNCEGFEIVAGQRRFNALKVLEGEGISNPVPCGIMEDGDDAAALEASLAENFARKPNNELDEYRAFADLIGQGNSAEDVAARFGVTERYVNQRMAISNIIPPILKAYEKGEIRPDILRALTLASKRKQGEWWKLVKADDPHVPTHSAHHLKQWLLGGNLLTIHALFDEGDYKKPIIGDLFGEERYFSDAKLFWQLQNKEISARRYAYDKEEWAAVHILEVGERWLNWEHVRVPKTKGGHVFIETSHDGEVKFHEGYLPQKEYERRQKAAQKGQGEGDAPKTAKPELTQAMENYLGLHRHAAVQAELLNHPSIALRLTVAHMVAGSGLWSVKADSQKGNNTAITESISGAKAVAVMGEEQTALRQLLKIGAVPDEGEDEDEEQTDDAELEDSDIEDDEDEGYHHSYYGGSGRDSGKLVRAADDWGCVRNLETIFDALMGMDDAEVMRVMTLAMAETLCAHTPIVGKLAALMGTDMRNWWKPETTFFDLLRDKEAISAMVREVAGDHAADANVTATAKAQKAIITDALEGRRTLHADNWLPRYLANPASGYTDRAASSYAPDVSVEDDQD